MHMLPISFAQLTDFHKILVYVSHVANNDKMTAINIDEKENNKTV